MVKIETNDHDKQFFIGPCLFIGGDLRRAKDYKYCLGVSLSLLFLQHPIKLPFHISQCNLQLHQPSEATAYSLHLATAATAAQAAILESSCQFHPSLLPLLPCMRPPRPPPTNYTTRKPWSAEHLHQVILTTTLKDTHPPSFARHPRRLRTNCSNPPSLHRPLPLFHLYRRQSDPRIISSNSKITTNCSMNSSKDASASSCWTMTKTTT